VEGYGINEGLRGGIPPYGLSGRLAYHIVHSNHGKLSRTAPS